MQAELGEEALIGAVIEKYNWGRDYAKEVTNSIQKTLGCDFKTAVNHLLNLTFLVFEVQNGKTDQV